MGKIRGGDQRSVEKNQGLAWDLQFSRRSRKSLRCGGDFPPWKQSENEFRFEFLRPFNLRNNEAFIDGADFKDPKVNPQRPARSSMSSTVESFSGPRQAQPQLKPTAVTTRKCPQPIVPDDCRSDCDSSSSVVDDGEDIASSSRRKTLPFDLNFPPLDELDDLTLCL